MSFSQGAALAATLLINAQSTALKSGQDMARYQPPFKWAVFLSGGLPFDYDALSQGEARQLAPCDEAEKISIPTALAWGSNDSEYPGVGEQLSLLCAENKRLTVVHTAGHGLPSQGKQLEFLVNAIKDTIDRS